MNRDNSRGYEAPLIESYPFTHFFIWIHLLSPGDHKKRNTEIHLIALKIRVSLELRSWGNTMLFQTKWNYERYYWDWVLNMTLWNRLYPAVYIFWSPSIYWHVQVNNVVSLWLTNICAIQCQYNHSISLQKTMKTSCVKNPIHRQFSFLEHHEQIMTYVNFNTFSRCINKICQIVAV